MRPFTYEVAWTNADESALNAAASPTSEMNASAVPALTDAFSSCLIRAGALPENARAASLTVTSSLKRPTPSPQVYRQVLEAAASSDIETPAAILALRASG